MAGKAEIARENGKKGGRPKGSTNVPRFADYVSEEERQKFVEFILDQYMGDMRLALWLGDHAFIKPRQDVDVTTNGKELPTPILNAIPSDHSPKEDKGD